MAKTLKILGWELMRISKSHATFEHHLPKILSLLDVDCIIDVGANEGQYGELLRSIGYRGRIASFEPSPAAFELLRKRSSRAGDWQVYAFALGSRQAVRPLNLTNESLFTSFLSPNEFAMQRFGERPAVVRREDVKIERLDAIFSEIVDGLSNPRVFLKMDTQGYDLETFAGASGCLEHVVGLQTELSVTPLYAGMSDYVSALSEYRKAGFEVTGLYPLFRDRRTLVLGEIDCVMTRRPG